MRICIKQLDLPAINMGEAHHAADRSALSCSIRTYKSHDITSFEGEAYLLQFKPFQLLANIVYFQNVLFVLQNITPPHR
ncbi:hypothetical protein D3C77_622390 [compost metagenome]